MQEDDLQALRTAVAALEHPGLAALVISAGAQRTYLFELPNLGQVGAYLRAAHDASERTDLRYSRSHARDLETCRLRAMARNRD